MIRVQQQGVHHAEDRGVGADAESQRQNRHHRETGALAEQVGAEAQVLKDGLEERNPAGFAVLLFRLLRTAEAH